MRASIAATLAAGWLVTSTMLLAQSDWMAVLKLDAGSVVRVDAGSRRAIGTVRSVTDTSLIVVNGFGDVATFARPDIDRVELFIGDPHPKRKGALKGALWSLLLAIPATLGSEMGGSDRKDLPWLYTMIVGSGAAIGAWSADAARTIVVYRR